MSKSKINKELTAQYKAEKAAGTTDAKNFPTWLALQNVGTTEEVVANLKETIAVADAALASVDVTPKALSKASIAAGIFETQLKEHGAKMVRKDVIALFVEAGLTIAGAKTYYQNFREKAGLVTHKAV